MSADLAAVAEAVLGQTDGRLIPGDPEARPELIDATHDSRQVGRGWLFCCLPGAHFDGHDFAPAAVEAGAAALLVERELDVDRPQIVVPHVRSAMGHAAAVIHDHPSSQLTLFGVTGTNGKSSMVQIMADIWDRVGVSAEIIGTLKGAHTTPEATDLQRSLRQAADRGTEAMAIEVSSHALAMGRVNGCRFAVAVFTNLTQDHLDFHSTMEDYFEAKALLFRPELSDHAVVNADDPWGRRLIDRGSIPVDTYSLDDAEDLRFDGPTSRFGWRGQAITLPLAGAHNVANALGAARAAEVLGLDPDDIAEALRATAPVRGRFEAVEAGQPFHIAVDYAHTPDALQAALVAARQVVGRGPGGGRVIVVFGCGGDRDVAKRAEMGRVAADGAEVVVVTSDNPRSEDPQSIIDDILEGIEATNRSRNPSDHLLVEPDRQAAITAAMSRAAEGDMVLIAGKGHETYQIIGDQTVEFDDRRAALVALGVVS